jgi:UDP-2,4-diacetamido-2,4,6-trideoxy-beta-L-altropyranose hydrolase
MTSDNGLANRPIIFRCDGSPDIGLGHVMRCVTLARDFQASGAGPIQFLSRSLSPIVATRLEMVGFDVCWLESQLPEEDDLLRTIEASRAAGREPAVVITDSHDFSENYYLGLKSAGRFVVSIDDLGTPRYASDLIINHHINAKDYTFWIGASSRLLLGPRYLPLRHEFRTRLREKRAPRGSSRLIVSLGGMPVPDHLFRVMSGIDRLLRRGHALTVTVVAGFGMNEAQRAKITKNCVVAEVIDSEEDPAAAFAAADVAVVNGSLTAYEAAALGLPLVMIAMDPNQTDTVHGFEAAGACVVVPPIEKLDEAGLADIVERVLTNESAAAELSKRARALVDGLGGERIVAETVQLCRRSGPDPSRRSDAEFVRAVGDAVRYQSAS